MDYGLPYAYVSSMQIMLLLLTCENVIQCLRPALLDIRKMCYQISDTNLFRMEKKHTYTLQEFQDTLFKQQEVQLYIHVKMVQMVDIYVHAHISVLYIFVFVLSNP